MGIILPVASGKGGVGKTALTVNIGACLAKKGKKVILVDLDLGASNLHTFLGVKGGNSGIGGFINKKTSDFNALPIKTSIPGLSLISGDALLPGTANLNYFMKLKIIKALKKLDADFILLDLGAGSANNTLDYFNISSNGLIVTIPETTAILNAYSFLKFSQYRIIFRSFRPDSEERRLIKDFLSSKIEGTDKSLNSLKSLLAPCSSNAVDIVDSALKTFVPGIIINRGKTQSDTSVGEKLRQIVSKNLNIKMKFIGLIPESEVLVKSLFKRIPAFVLFPDSPFSRSVSRLSDKLIDLPDTATPHFFADEEEDLGLIEEEYKSLY